MVLDSDIPSTDEGAITIPEGVKVILTDEGKGYSITRTATTETELKDALFKVVANAEMILAGNIPWMVLLLVTIWHTSLWF